jgi:hypothetical protein
LAGENTYSVQLNILSTQRKRQKIVHTPCPTDID